METAAQREIFLKARERLAGLLQGGAGEREVLGACLRFSREYRAAERRAREDADGEA